MSTAFTERQQEVLDFIRNHIREKGWPPTRVEIRDAFGMSGTTGVNEHLWALERKGALRIVDKKSRGIVLIESKSATPGTFHPIARGRDGLLIVPGSTKPPKTPSERGLERLTVYLPVELATRLRVHAAQTRKDMSDIVAGSLSSTLGGSR